MMRDGSARWRAVEVCPAEAGAPAELPRGGQHEGEPGYEGSFVQVRGARLHYLDFGGEGLPVVFVHSEAWDAHTYAEFAPRFADRNRVLAVTILVDGDPTTDINSLRRVVMVVKDGRVHDPAAIHRALGIEP